MRLLHPYNNKIQYYLHIHLNVESWGYSLQSYPQCKNLIPSLQNWQLVELIKNLEDEAKIKGLLLRHCK